MSDPNQLHSETIAALLSRGGLCLGLAAAARAHGVTAKNLRFHALDDGLTEATRKILQTLEDTRDYAAVATAIGLGMSSAPATRAPAWTNPYSEDPTLIDAVGKGIDPLWPPFRQTRCSDERSAGLACLAIALCRSTDAAEAFARSLPQQDAAALRPMLQLARVCVSPGEPGRMRARLAEIVPGAQKGQSWGG